MTSHKVYRVKREDLVIGAAIEKEEHPWAGDRTVRHLARDHLQQDPDAYRKEQTIELVRSNVQQPAKKKKKQQQQQPQGKLPFWQTYGQELL